MFNTIAALARKPQGLTPRGEKLTVLSSIVDGTFYDGLPYEFHDERNGAGEYIPLRQRRPSVRYGLCRIVVDDSVNFLFGEGRWPAVECDDDSVQDALQLVLAESNLSETMAYAAVVGSVGSVVVLFRVLSNRVFWEVKATTFLTPKWKADEPDVLESLTEKRQVRGQDLRDSGYPVADDDLSAAFWWQVQWTAVEETWFVPQKTTEDKPMSRDAARSVVHKLGFVPAVWIKNLAGSSTGDVNDGGCTFRLAVDAQIEIDYQLSQAGRGLKYSSDPTLLIKEPAAALDGDILKGAADALIVSEKGDAKLLEIGGTAAQAVVEYVRTLREMALESVHGNRANADRLAAAQSGRALELLYAPLIGLVDRLRVPYGNAVLKLAQMIVVARGRVEIKAFGQAIGDLPTNHRLTLRWPAYFTATPHDQQMEINSLGAARREGLISQETAVARVSASWDIGDATEELQLIKADEQAADARAKNRGDQIQDRQSLPA